MQKVKILVTTADSTHVRSSLATLMQEQKLILAPTVVVHIFVHSSSTLVVDLKAHMHVCWATELAGIGGGGVAGGHHTRKVLRCRKNRKIAACTCTLICYLQSRSCSSTPSIPKFFHTGSDANNGESSSRDLRPMPPGCSRWREDMSGRRGFYI